MRAAKLCVPKQGLSCLAPCFLEHRGRGLRRCPTRSIVPVARCRFDTHTHEHRLDLLELREGICTAREGTCTACEVRVRRTLSRVQAEKMMQRQTKSISNAHEAPFCSAEQTAPHQVPGPARQQRDRVQGDAQCRQQTYKQSLPSASKLTDWPTATWAHPSLPSPSSSTHTHTRTHTHTHRDGQGCQTLSQVQAQVGAGPKIDLVKPRLMSRAKPSKSAGMSRAISLQSRDPAKTGLGWACRS